MSQTEEVDINPEIILTSARNIIDESYSYSEGEVLNNIVRQLIAN